LVSGAHDACSAFFCWQAAPLCWQAAPLCWQAAPLCWQAAPLCWQTVPLLVLCALFCSFVLGARWSKSGFLSRIIPPILAKFARGAFFGGSTGTLAGAIISSLSGFFY